MTLVRGDWFFILLVLIDGFFMARPYLYSIQQDNYRVSEVFKSKRLAFVYLIDIVTVILFLLIWTLLYFLQARAFWGFATAMFFFIAEFALYFMEDLPDRKKPLRYTKRAVRCLFFVSLATAGTVTAVMAFCNERLSDVYLRYLIFFAMPVVFPLIFMVAASFINIFERANNRRYERRCAKILKKNTQLIKIGITGSYAKTSVKNILTQMLKAKYNVLATPASFNTPMGIAKTVDNLDSTYDVFIAEMGARRVGDIKKLMQIVKPQYSILTGINVQHLETFGSPENIVREKSRVVNMLEEGGFAVVNSKLYARFGSRSDKKHPDRIPVFAGLDEEADVRAENLTVTGDGSVFDLVIDERAYPAVTQLIGRHNIENITLAAAMAYGLGVCIFDIIDAISILEPVPHRMQLISGNGIKIIDDSFNSNPDGARCSLETLDMIEGRKVVMTPGLVELGARENEENYILGEEIAVVADEVLLIGSKRTDPIRRGLTEHGFGGEIRSYASLKDAEDAFGSVLHVGDVLLILNDLPDIYEEKRQK